MEYVQMSFEDYMSNKQEIGRTLLQTAKNFVKIGWLLWRIDASGMYKDEGYKSIAEFDMKPDAVSRFMRVYETYSVEGDTPQLKPQYEQFKFAQLTEMLQLPDSDRNMITPDTKRESIRELNRFNAEQEHNPDILFGWQQDPNDKARQTMVNLLREKEEEITKVLNESDFEEKLKEILNPAGNRSYRKGTVFLMLNENNIGVKVYGQENRESTWQQLAEIAREELQSQEDVQETIEEVQESKEDVETTMENAQEVEEEQIPGQDSIMNHPELMPEKTEKTVIAPAQKTPKTEEQKYAEKQRRIDKKTEAALEEMEDEEKMKHLPSDEKRKVQQLRIGFSFYEEMNTGRNFDLRKSGDFKVGDILEYMLFDQEKFTGKSLKRQITFVLTDKDASGLEKDYTILGLAEI